ncbi:MAG: glycosyltransferase family 39 protein [Candidatus Altiarchaeota archaeon]|nr:glycosyltransferase family 39 protein [Candidatus Altiarchaeota archaeon]
MFTKNERFIFLFVLLTLLPFTNNIVWENDASRIATAESVVDWGRLEITNSTFAPKTDKILVDGKYYSNKHFMSVLPAVMSYAVLSVANVKIASNSPTAIYLINILSVGLATSLFAVIFRRLLLESGMPKKKSTLFSLMLIYATPVLNYSVTYNNHILSAFINLCSFYFLKRFTVKRNMYDLLMCGLLMGYGIGVDLPSGIVFSAVFIFYLLGKNITLKQMKHYFIGLIPPVLLFFAVNYLVFSSVYPDYFNPQYYHYTGSQFFTSSEATLDGETLQVTRTSYILNMLFGGQGFFTHTPLLLLSAFSLIAIASDKKSRFR